MENTYEKLKAALVVGGIIVALVAIPSVIAWGNSLYPSRTVTVSADGKITVSPDIATVSFSVLTQGADPVKLETDNAKRMTDAINFVKSEGLESKDIATTSYNLSPNYEYDKYRKTTYINGYTLTQTANLKIRDFSKVAPILGGLSERGVNQIGSVTFSVEDADKYLASARSEAFAKAAAKAAEMAKATGAHLGRILGFSDYGSGPQPYYSAAEGRGGIMTAASVAPPVEPGTQELTAQVSITYELQ